MKVDELTSCNGYLWNGVVYQGEVDGKVCAACSVCGHLRETLLWYEADLRRECTVCGKTQKFVLLHNLTKEDYNPSRRRNPEKLEWPKK